MEQSLMQLYYLMEVCIQLNECTKEFKKAFEHVIMGECSDYEKGVIVGVCLGVFLECDMGECLAYVVKQNDTFCRSKNFIYMEV